MGKTRDDYYRKDAEKVLRDLDSSPAEGLSHEEARNRLEKYGLNELVEKEKISPVKIFLSQFKDLMVIILIIAGAISAFLGEISDMFVIMGIVILNSIIGFILEYKAERAIEALKQMVAPHARVLRGGKEHEIPAKELVPGDIIILEEGAKIPADARVILSSQLSCDEAALTGESVPETKKADAIDKDNLIVGDKKNMVFMGTNATHGSGKAVVVATGMDTEFGKVASLTQDIKKEKSPLQKQMEKVGKFIAKATFVICAIVFLLGVFRFGFTLVNIVEMFKTAVSLAVAAVPEGLPVTITLALATGVRRMLKKNAIIRRLPSVETLGCTNVICSDKTGTLTRNEMTVGEMFISGKIIRVEGVGYEPNGRFMIDEKPVGMKDVNGLDFFLSIGAGCNNSSLKEPSEDEKKWRITGDPTEGALVVAAAKAGLTKEDVLKQYPKLHEIPFDSTRKRMTTVHKKGKSSLAFVKGAPDVVLERCSHIEINGKQKKITKELKKEILERNNSMASRALRVIAIAYREIPGYTKKYEEDIIENHLTFVGLMGMVDPPRPEVKDAIWLCKKAGIKIIMVTGDYGLTAKAIGKTIGLADDSTRVVTGAELNDIKDDELNKILEEEHVIFARVSPEHKLRIVTSLSDKGKIVAVTGDGVNDAPALKKASIGVAMGSGTDVSKEASEMILTDDSFASIVGAIKEGRTIYDNIRKFTLFIMSCNMGELMTVFIGILIGLPLPLLPIQILAVNLGTDVLPSLALGIEPAETDIMDRKPRERKEKILSGSSLKKILMMGILIAIGSLAFFTYELLSNGWSFGTALAKSDPLYAKATTVCLVTLIVYQLFNAFNFKTHYRSLFKTNLFNNIALIGAVLSSVLLCLVLVYVPFFQKIFHTAALSLVEWVFIVAVSSSILFLDEAHKMLIRKRGENGVRS